MQCTPKSKNRNIKTAECIYNNKKYDGHKIEHIPYEQDYDSIKFIDRLTPSNNIFRFILNIFKNTIGISNTKSTEMSF